VSGRTYPRYRCGGRFFGRRVNCEQVPALPAGVVREVLNDPRRIPYLLIWKSPRDGDVKEAVRVIRLDPPPYLPTADAIEIKRTDGSVSHIRAIKRSLPRNGGYTTLLACPYCCSLRHTLYGWEAAGPYTTSAQTCTSTDVCLGRWCACVARSWKVVSGARKAVRLDPFRAPGPLASLRV
jgi:hypothetical protein